MIFPHQRVLGEKKVPELVIQDFQRLFYLNGFSLPAI